MREKDRVIPTGWTQTALGECLELVNGRAYKRAEMLSSGTPILRIQNLNKGDKWFYSDLELDEDKYCEAGDLLYAWSATFGPYIWWGDRSIYHYHIWKIKLPSSFEKKFAYYLLQEITEEIKAAAHGVAMPHMTKSGMEAWQVAIPPLNEQRRIVEKIEELGAHTLRSQQALDEIPALIDQFRQSVLAAAFRGDLTADWRKRNPDVEPAEKLLEQILEERHRHWEEAELAKMRAKGKELKNDRWKEKYKEPILIKTEDAQAIFPRKWTLSLIEPLLSVKRTGMKTGPFGSLLKKSDHQQTGIPVLGIENISESGFIPGNKIFITAQKASELSEYSIQANDIIISRSGTVGEVCVLPEGIGQAIISTNLIKVTPFEKYISPKYLSYLFKGSSFVLAQIKKLCAGSTRDFLNQSILNQLVLPIPPFEEQIAIVAKVERILSVIDGINAQSDEMSNDLSYLNQSILAKAFRGELVPQDPNDEPASVLLDRIRAEREKLGTTKTQKRSSRKRSQ